MAESCKDWNSNWSPEGGGWCMESWRGPEGGPVWDMSTEEAAAGRPISPQT